MIIKEYFAVARYIIRTEDGVDQLDSIYKRLEKDLTTLIKFDRQEELKDMFFIIEGENLTEEDYENN